MIDDEITDSSNSKCKGNCKADELGRGGTTIEFSGEFLSIDFPLRTSKLMIDDEITDSSNSKWAASDKGRRARMI